MRSKGNARRWKSVAKKGISPSSECKTKVDSPIASATSKLLGLPPELRLLIYDIYFSSPSYGKGFPKTNPFDGYTVIDIDVDASLMGALMDRFGSAKSVHRSERARSNINLLSVCRLIYSEAIPRFYHNHLFRLPTYSDLPPGLAAPIKPLVIPVSMTRHFDLIHRLEVVHHHLGDAIADRENTDLAIAALLGTISKSCQSLRCLSIRVICDLYYEMECFEDMSGGGDYLYLDFERKTPGVLAALMPRLRELAITLVDSKLRLVVGHPELPPKAFSGTWTLSWHVDEAEEKVGEQDKRGEESKEGEADEEGEDNGDGGQRKDAFMERWGERFFTCRPKSSSEFPSMDEVLRDSLYQIASMEPFAHWYDPEMA